MAEKKSTNIKVTLKNVRLSFPHLFRPQVKEFDDGGVSKKFNAAFLIDKKTQGALIDKIEDAIEECKKAKWGENPPKIKAEKLCLRDGDDEDYDGYAGMMFVSSSNSKRPPVVDRDGRTPLSEEDGKPYAGCYVNAVIHLWAQDNKHGKRINASLEAVQFVRDGDAFGAQAINPEDVFEDLGDDEDDAPKSSRSRSRDEDDEEDRPRRNRSRDEDDEDRPRRNRSRDVDSDDIL